MSKDTELIWEEEEHELPRHLCWIRKDYMLYSSTDFNVYLYHIISVL
jgi:hypothetical protein